MEALADPAGSTLTRSDPGGAGIGRRRRGRGFSYLGRGGELGKDCDFGDLATRDHAEKAVVKLLARQA